MKLDTHQHAAGRWGWAGDVLALLWGLAEGTLFFVVPDMSYTFTAGVSPMRGLRRVGLVIAGSLAAGCVMYLWAQRDAAAARHAVESVPFVRGWMLDRVWGDFAASGAGAPLLGSFSGIPYKVYAVLAPDRVSLPAFLLVSVPARAERLLITWALFAAAGWGLRRWTRRSRMWLGILYAVYWIAVYAVYWSRV